MKETLRPESGGMDDKVNHTDPPAYSNDVPSTYIKPQHRKAHDAGVLFEEYYYYAQTTRKEEETLEAPPLNVRDFLLRKKPAHDINDDVSREQFSDNRLTKSNRLEISDQEWTNASRAFRTASWGACFFLITTDILGPYSIGFALGTLGWGPGIALFTVFGFMAGYSGYLIRHVFLGVDSYEFPARNYGKQPCCSSSFHCQVPL